MRSWDADDATPPRPARPPEALSCLKCGKRFMSPDRRRTRLCRNCDRENANLSSRCSGGPFSPISHVVRRDVNGP